MKIKLEYGKIKSLGGLTLCAERGKEIKAVVELTGGVRVKDYDFLELEQAGVYWVYVLFWWRRNVYIVSKQVRVPKEKEVVLDFGEKRLYEYPDISKAEQEKILGIIEEAGFEGVSKEKDGYWVRVGMKPKEIDEVSFILEEIQVNQQGWVSYYFGWWYLREPNEEPEPEEPQQPEEPHDDEPEEDLLFPSSVFPLSALPHAGKTVRGEAPRCFERGKPIIQFPPGGFLSGKNFTLMVRRGWGSDPHRFNVTIGKQILPLKALIMELPEILRIVKGIGWAVNGLGIEN